MVIPHSQLLKDLSLSTALLDKRESRIRRMFGEIAPKYDFLNHLLSANVDRYWRWKTTKLVPVRDSGPILDLCTGTGDLAFAYYRATKRDVPIVGADFCHEMLVRAEEKARQRKFSEMIHFVEADAQELPFASNTFEVVTVAFGLRNVTDTNKGIQEMVRVARPGGRIAILEFSKPKHWFLGRMYRLYFKFVLPMIGQLFSRSKDSAYKYLPASVMEFPEGEAMIQKLQSHGLKEVVHYPFTFGIASLYVGTKPNERMKDEG
jgi:demethylmenaquinone methyltransferase / 2-methoxy-6-polyprenyl-1,4-benzoquinol methylase